VAGESWVRGHALEGQMEVYGGDLATY